jgi:hypothetical protein
MWSTIVSRPLPTERRDRLGAAIELAPFVLTQISQSYKRNTHVEPEIGILTYDFGQ